MLYSSRNIPVQTMASPAKKEKWSQQEDTTLINLRAGGMRWEDISKDLPGRSAISCRLHYQNYLNPNKWNQDTKNKLAMLYERYVKKRCGGSRGLNFADRESRHKADMWKKIADEMSMFWSEVEAMHWQMGKDEMARRVASQHPYTGRVQELGTFHLAQYAPQETYLLSPTHEQRSLSSHSDMMESGQNLGGMAMSQQMDFQQQARLAPPGHRSFLSAQGYTYLGTSDPQQYAFGSGNRNRQ